jgi:hypothetical protein
VDYEIAEGWLDKVLCILVDYIEADNYEALALDLEDIEREKELYEEQLYGVDGCGPFIRYYHPDGSYEEYARDSKD